MANTYIVLFRGLNVGGRVAKMETLRDALTGVGFGNVKTYIQSGNVVLTSERDEADAATLIYRTFSGAFGYSSRPTLRSLEAWQRVIDENPFAAVLKEGRQEHAVFLDAHPAEDAIDALRGLATTEEIVVRDGVLYLHTPDGFGTSPVAAALDKVLKVPLTARNWNTVLKLRDMAEAIMA